MSMTQDPAPLQEPGTPTEQHLEGIQPRRDHPDDWQSRVWGDLRHKPAPILLLALAVAAFVTILTAGLSVHGRTVWTSQTTILLDNPYSLALAGDPGQLSKMSSLRYKYADLAGTYAIAQPVAASLHVPVGVVLGSTTVAVPSNSVLMYAVGTSTSPTFAQEVSAALAAGIEKYIQSENATYKVPASDQVFAIPVNPATAPSGSGPSKSRAALLSLIAFLGTFVVVFVPSQLVVARSNRR